MRRLMLVVGMLSLVATACSGSGSHSAPSGSPLAVVSGAAGQTAKAQSAHMTFTVEGAGIPTVTGNGGFDFAAKRGTLSLDLPAVGGVALGKADMVLDGTVFYMRLPAALTAQLAGKPWVRFDLSTLGRRLTGADLSSLTQAQSADPTQAVNVLRGATDVTKVGTETLRGASVTHYKVTIDLDKAVAASPPESRDALQKLVGELGTKTFPADVWVDGDGRMRKLTYSLDLSKVSVPTSAGGSPTALGTSTFTYELYDFGTAVHADVPPSDQVTDLEDLLGK